MSLSLPPKLVRQISVQAEQEGKTKSEFVREALRIYIEMKELRKAQGFLPKRAQEIGIEDDSAVEAEVDDVRSGLAGVKK